MQMVFGNKNAMVALYKSLCQKIVIVSISAWHCLSLIRRLEISVLEPLVIGAYIASYQSFLSYVWGKDIFTHRHCNSTFTLGKANVQTQLRFQVEIFRNLVSFRGLRKRTPNHQSDSNETT